MRLAVGLLAFLGAGALTSALADPQAEAQSRPAQTSAAAARAPAAAASPSASDTVAPRTAAPRTAAAAQAATAKPELDQDTQHFLAEGYKPEMHGGEQIYCRKETALGSRLSPVKNCGTIEQLKVAEQRTKSGVFDAQRQQIGTSFH